MAVSKVLKAVWSGQSGWVDLPTKTNGYWSAYHVCLDEEDAWETIEQRIATSQDCDLYFSPLTFTHPGRERDHAKPSRWLFADLDEARLDDLPIWPTIIWRTSGQRHQALWLLTKPVSPRIHEQLNSMLTYVSGADRSGWDLTQVLRVPGSMNHKYDPPQRVKLVEHSGEAFEPRALHARLKDLGAVPVGTTAVREAASGSTRGPVPRLPARAQALLRARDAVTGERSARLWELECLLVEAGLDDGQIYDLCWESVWNKWRDVATGPQRLGREIAKARVHVGRKVSAAGEARDKSTANGAGGGVSNVADMETVRSKARASNEMPNESRARRERVGREKKDSSMGEANTEAEAEAEADRGGFATLSFERMMVEERDEGAWLIEGWWTLGNYGIIGGEAKTSKSTLAMAMALSVASGVPFLKVYEVPEHARGPALIVQAENSPRIVRRRTKKIGYWYGMMDGAGLADSPRAGDSPQGPDTPPSPLGYKVNFVKPYPFVVANVPGLNLLDEEDRARLWATIERGFEGQPWKFVVLDPLYLMLGSADESSSQHLRPVLQWLRELALTFDCSLAVVHHMKKRSTDSRSIQVRPGQRLLGTSLFHNWLECGIYCDVDPTSFGTGRLRVTVDREFREQENPGLLGVELTMGDPGSVEGFTATVDEPNKREQKAEEYGELVAKVKALGRVKLVEFADMMGSGDNTHRARRVASAIPQLKLAKAGRTVYVVYVDD